jgi:hypothetical protein
MARVSLKSVGGKAGINRQNWQPFAAIDHSPSNGLSALKVVRNRSAYWRRYTLTSLPVLPSVPTEGWFENDPGRGDARLCYRSGAIVRCCRFETRRTTFRPGKDRHRREDIACELRDARPRTSRCCKNTTRAERLRAVRGELTGFSCRESADAEKATARETSASRRERPSPSDGRPCWLRRRPTPGAAGGQGQPVLDRRGSLAEGR